MFTAIGNIDIFAIVWIKFLYSHLYGDCSLFSLSFSSLLCLSDELIAVMINAKQKQRWDGNSETIFAAAFHLQPVVLKCLPLI